MARLYTGKRGSAGSKKYPATSRPVGFEPNPPLTLELVEKLAKEGKNEAEIGRVLRDEHKIPSVKMVTGKTISQILKEKKLQGQYPSDLLDLIKRAMSIRRHLKLNSRDVHNRRNLTLTESKIRRLVAFYRGKRLPSNWKYDPATAGLLVK
jgi:small subunit ribosomal protein S15